MYHPQKRMICTSPERGITEPRDGTSPERGITEPRDGTSPERGITEPRDGSFRAAGQNPAQAHRH